MEDSYRGLLLDLQNRSLNELVYKYHLEDLSSRLPAFACAAIFTILWLIGVFGNLLSIGIFGLSQFRQLSINLLLLARSVADFMLIFLSWPVFAVAPLVVAKPSYYIVLDPIYAIAAVYVLPPVLMAQCASVWLLVVVTVERWAAVCRPLLVGTYFTRIRAMLIIICITVCSICYNVVRFWEYELVEHYTLKPLLKANKEYVLWRVTIANLATTYLIPLIILVTLNFQIAKEIFHSSQIRCQMSVTEKGNRKTAKMLLYVVLMFIICYTLSLTLNLWENVEPSRFDTAFGEILSDISNILAVLNSATTWIFYLKFSTRYRTAAKMIVSNLCQCNRSYQAIPPLYSMTLRGSQSGTLSFRCTQNESCGSTIYRERAMTYAGERKPKSESSKTLISMSNLSKKGTVENDRSLSLEHCL